MITWRFDGFPGLGLEVLATYSLKVGLKKTRVPGLPVGEYHMILGSLVLMHYQRETDRWTNCP